MSETLVLPPGGAPEVKRVPTVYFIDDSATMREVIKIAFRRENMNVITCADAASAISQFEQQPPDAVITDVIMPDQDGYAVCSQIKQHPQYGATPVILMSGVVNKNVADRAVAVHADELIRKPFQPQELIGRVKSLLQPKTDATVSGAASQPGAASTESLRSLFALPATPQPVVPPPQAASDPAWPRALADAFVPRPAAPPAPAAPSAGLQQRTADQFAHDVRKLRSEILRLELLVKKLQTELQIEREYNQTLELHIKTIREND